MLIVRVGGELKIRLHGLTDKLVVAYELLVLWIGEKGAEVCLSSEWEVVTSKSDGMLSLMFTLSVLTWRRNKQAAKMMNVSETVFRRDSRRLAVLCRFALFFA